MSKPNPWDFISANSGEATSPPDAVGAEEVMKELQSARRQVDSILALLSDTRAILTGAHQLDGHGRQYARLAAISGQGAPRGYEADACR